MHRRKRMIDPVILNDSDLETLEKQVLFLAMNQFAEDSGCLILDYRALRKGAFPQFPRVSIAEVEQMVIELTEADMIWPYEVGATRCAYIPSFPTWNSSRTRQNAPDTVPLPDGVIYQPFNSEKRRGSGIYHYPATKLDLIRQWCTSCGVELSDEDIEF